MDRGLLEILICPRHQDHPLEERGQDLVCPCGCTYPIVQGIPVLLLDDVEQTQWVARASLEKARQLRALPSAGPDPCIETLGGLTAQERASLRDALRSKPQPADVDLVVQYVVGATNGILYRSLAGRLSSYPIPDLKLPAASGAWLLDMGCNWGRWCVAAARRGYLPIGIDPSLGAVLAARRICRSLQAPAQFIVADSRHLPFTARLFDVVFSYSVLQHFGEQDVRATLQETARVLKPGGTSMIQMPNAFGIRNLYNQARRGFRHARGFEVRYWTPAALKKTFERFLGPTSLPVDCFFGLGIQDTHEQILPPRHRLVVRASRAVRSISQKFHPLRVFADSLYACSVKPDLLAASPGPLRKLECRRF